jgi:hypothetical protein
MDTVKTPEDNLPKKQPSPEQLDQLIAAVDRAYHRPWLMMWRSFLHGIMVSLGATIGAGLVLLIVGWILLQLDWTPIGRSVWEMLIPQTVREQLEPTPSQDAAQGSDQASITYSSRNAL